MFRMRRVRPTRRTALLAVLHTKRRGGEGIICDLDGNSVLSASPPESERRCGACHALLGEGEAAYAGGDIILCDACSDL